jgi:hypothetical protein
LSLPASIRPTCSMLMSPTLTASMKFSVPQGGERFPVRLVHPIKLLERGVAVP